MKEKLELSIALSNCYFLSTKDKNFLLKAIKNIDDFLLMSLYDMSVLLGRTIKHQGWNPKKIFEKVKCSIRLMELYSIGMVLNTEKKFPSRLNSIPNVPFAIYFRGVLPEEFNRSIAIVGTRRPTGAGIKTAMRIASEFAEKKICVVSGLALGIDTFAHKGVLSKYGSTVSVLACGVENIYPKTNSKLAGKILESGGCIISEYAPGTPGLKHRFPERNRIISGLSDYILIVEAPIKSGALITADYAFEQGKHVYVCSELLESIQNKGCIHLYDNGAIAITHADEILYSDSSVVGSTVIQKELFSKEYKNA